MRKQNSETTDETQTKFLDQDFNSQYAVFLNCLSGTPDNNERKRIFSANLITTVSEI